MTISLGSVRVLRIAACLGFVFALADPGLAQPTIIRHVTPAAWQANDVDWIRDQVPRNKIDDLIDSSTNTSFDIVVNYKRCPDSGDIAFLDQLGTVSMECKYITTVAVDDVLLADVDVIAQQPDVAFVEMQVGFGPALDVSVPNIKVAAGFHSPNTIEDLDPDLTGAGVNIVIMDTGVDNLHLAFQQTPIIGFYDAVVRMNIDPADLDGHGTHVASIALGQATSGTARGVAPAAGLIDVRVLGGCDKSDRCCFWAAAVHGLETVYDRRDALSVDIINMSFEQCLNNASVESDGLDAFCQLVDLATTMGIVVVVAGGNGGSADCAPAGLITAPAASTRALTVAAYHDSATAARTDDARFAFSNCGPRKDDGDADCLDELKPEVAAPGVRIHAAQRGTASQGTEKDGTSMAAPHVAGLCALLMQQRPGINAGSVRELIISSAEPRGAPSAPNCDPIWNREWGWGAICAYTAAITREITDLTYPSHPWSPHWKSPDISVSPAPEPGFPTTVTVLIENRGTADAHDARVNLGVHLYSAAIPTFYDIGTQVVSVVPAGQTVPVQFPWVPVLGAHQCLKAEIEYGADTDFGNNQAQRNVKVTGPQAFQGAPVEFEVRNTLSESRLQIDLIPTLETGADGWQVVVNPSTVLLEADDCPATVSLELIPPIDAIPGESAFVDVAAETIDPAGGPVQLGGVTLVHYVDGATTSPPTAATTPDRPTLGRGAPNPFAHEVELPFTLPRELRVRIAIYDVAGRLVRVVADGELPAGRHTAMWDGRNERGLRAGGGTYFARLEAGTELATSKIVFRGD